MNEQQCAYCPTLVMRGTEQEKVQWLTLRTQVFLENWIRMGPATLWPDSFLFPNYKVVITNFRSCIHRSVFCCYN